MTPNKQGKKIMLIMAGNHQQFAQWFNKFKIPSFYERVSYIDSLEKLRGYDPKTTEIFRLGTHYENPLFGKDIEKYGYEIIGRVK